MNIKRLLLIFACLLVTVSAENQRIVQVGGAKYIGAIQWHKRISGGSTTTFAVGTDTVLITGASDSLYSCVYRAKDFNVVQFDVSGGTTVRFQLKVLVANSGDYTALSIPDSLFQDQYWITSSSGIDFVSTSQDSIQAEGIIGPIYLPIYGELIKFVIFSSPDQVGNTTITSNSSILMEE